MESRALWRRLLEVVTPLEWSRLEGNDPSLMVGQFNRETLLSMRNAVPDSFEIPDTDIRGLATALRNYLNIYMSDQPDGHRWIILACLYLALIQKRPMHPKDKVRWECREENGCLQYFCPCKDAEGTVCDFCICQHT